MRLSKSGNLKIAATLSLLGFFFTFASVASAVYASNPEPAFCTDSWRWLGRRPDLYLSSSTTLTSSIVIVGDGGLEWILVIASGATLTISGDSGGITNGGGLYRYHG